MPPGINSTRAMATESSANSGSDASTVQLGNLCHELGATDSQPNVVATTQSDAARTVRMDLQANNVSAGEVHVGNYYMENVYITVNIFSSVSQDVSRNRACMWLLHLARCGRVFLLILTKCQTIDSVTASAPRSIASPTEQSLSRGETTRQFLRTARMFLPRCVIWKRRTSHAK